MLENCLFHVLVAAHRDALQESPRLPPTPLNPAAVIYSCPLSVGHLRCLPSFQFPSGAHNTMSWDPVYRLVKQIPRGRVITYGALAKAVRLPGGGRTAGRAMAATPRGKGIPWHRVVGAGGRLLIREPYAGLQRKLLESEGVTLLEFRVDIKRHNWQPPRLPSTKQKAVRWRNTKRARKD